MKIKIFVIAILFMININFCPSVTTSDSTEKKLRLFEKECKKEQSGYCEKKLSLLKKIYASNKELKAKGMRDPQKTLSGREVDIINREVVATVRKIGAEIR